MAVAAPTAEPFVIRLGGPDDDEAIAALIADAAPGNVKADPELLRWQYRSEEYGPTTTVVAEASGRLVGHYSAIAVPVAVNGRLVPAMRGVDGVTAASHRGQRIFPRSAALILDTARQRGVEVVLSNPNDLSLGGIASSGWDHIGDPRPLVRLVDGSAIVGRSPVPLPRPFADLAARALSLRPPIRDTAGVPTVARLEAPPADLETLDAQARPTFGIVRDARWWRWRYASHPVHAYHYLEARRGDRLVGAAVSSTRDDAGGQVLQLLDLVAVDATTDRALVDGAAAQAAELGAGAVVAAALAGTEWARRLRRAGFVPVPARLQPRPIHLLVADLTGSRPGLAAEPWTFTLGDQDHL